MYVCALIKNHFLRIEKCKFVFKVFFPPLIEIKVFYTINLLMVSKCITSNRIMCENYVGFFLNLEYMYMCIWKKKLLFCIDINI